MINVYLNMLVKFRRYSSDFF